MMVRGSLLVSALLIGVIADTVKAEILGDPCYNPAGDGGGQGRCVTVRGCAVVMAILRRDRGAMSPATLQLLQRAHCGFTDTQPLVCCPEGGVQSSWGVESTPTSPPNNLPTASSHKDTVDGIDGNTQAAATISADHPKLALLPLDRCGFSVMDRIARAPNELLVSDDVPTVARIGYVTRTLGRLEERFRCGGSLISSRYVLTAAHCVTGLEPGTMLSGVVLGDFDVTSDRDCERSANLNLPAKWGVCKPPARRFGVESIAIYPEYRTSARHHDLALLRLDRAVNFTEAELIPTCLPIGDFQFMDLNERNLLTMGWGTNLRGRVTSPFLRQGHLRTVSNSLCGYAHPGLASADPERAVCAAGKNDADDSVVDTGGPLSVIEIWSAAEGPRMVQIAVQTSAAAAPGLPTAFTRLGPYLPWILENIQP